MKNIKRVPRGKNYLGRFHSKLNQQTPQATNRHSTSNLSLSPIEEENINEHYYLKHIAAIENQLHHQQSEKMILSKNLSQVKTLYGKVNAKCMQHSQKIDSLAQQMAELLKDNQNLKSDLMVTESKARLYQSEVQYEREKNLHLIDEREKNQVPVLKPTLYEQATASSNLFEHQPITERYQKQGPNFSQLENNSIKIFNEANSQNPQLKVVDQRKTSSQMQECWAKPHRDLLDIEKLSKQLSSSKQKIQFMCDQIKVLKEKNSYLSKDFQLKQSQLQQALQSITEKEQSLRELQKNIASEQSRRVRDNQLHEKEIDDLNAKICDLAIIIEEDQKLSEHKKAIDKKFSEKLQALEGEKNELLKKVENIEDLEQSLEFQETQNRKKQVQIESLIEKVKSIESQMSSLQKEIAQLNSELADSKKAVENLKIQNLKNLKMVEHQKQKSLKLQLEFQSYKQMTLQKETQLDGLKCQAKDTQEHHAKCISVMEKTLEDQKTKQLKQFEEIQNLMYQNFGSMGIEKQKSKGSTLVQQILSSVKIISKTLVQYQKEKETLKCELQTQKDSYNQLQDYKAECKMIVQEYENRICSLKKNISCLENHVDQMKVSLKTYEAQIIQNQSKIEEESQKANKQVEVLEEKYLKIKCILEEKEAEFEKILEEKDLEIQEKEALIADRDSFIEKSKNKQNHEALDLEAKMRFLEEEKQEEIDSLLSDLDEMTKERDLLENNVIELSRRIEQLEAEDQG